MAELSRGQILKNPEVITGATGVGATVRLYDADESAYIDIKTPDAVGAAYTVTLPANDGDSGQVLQTDGDGTTSWVTVSAAAGGANTQLQFNDGGALAGTAATADASNIYITSASKIRFNDSDNSNYVAIGASDVVASNITYDLPASHGAVGEALLIQSVSGPDAVLEWGNPTAGTTQNPGGAGGIGEVQYNVGGTFTGEAAFTYDQTFNALTVDNIDSSAGIVTAGLLDVDDLRLDGTTISNTASTEINLDATFVDILNNTSLRFYSSGGGNYGAIKFNNPTSDYTLTFPATVGAANEVLQFDATGNASFVSNTRTLNFIIDGDGAAITTGIKGHVVIDADYTVTGWTVIADQSGSIVVDINRASFTNFPTTSSIAGTELPTLSGAQKAEDLTLSSWTTTLNARDVLEFEVDSASTVELVTIALRLVHR
jgi:hypothetical protein